jgi:lipopolysaccharide export system protein LptA
MRVGRDGVACVLVLLVCSGSLRAEDAPAPAAATRPNALFQGLSLGSGKGPVRIDSDSLELDYKGSLVTYTGNVHVAQGDIIMTSDRLSITYDPDAVRRPDQADAPKPKAAGGNDTERIKQIVAEGNVKIRQGNRLAEGRRAVFDQAKQTVVLSDGAVLHDGPNQVAGERVIVYLQEERSVVESGSRSRVKAVLYPGKDEANAKATPTATAPQQAAEAPAVPQAHP